MTDNRYINPGRRPSVDEIRAYYAREDVLGELLQGMQRWHVKFVPGYAKTSWLYTQGPEELRAAIEQPLNRMARDPKLVDYPYFRINWERHVPAWSWDEDTLWGYDFVIEKDAVIWQECFEAMLPVMDILDYFGVTYWLKYTGHHSLHLVIPAEAFPQTVRGRPLKDYHRALYHRLMVFLNKRANQRYNEHDRHCPPGTNMPYSVNEDTGLLNYPLLREELASFRPWHASIYLAQVRGFWRIVPEGARGTAGALLDEVLKPYPEQTRFYAPIPRSVPAQKYDDPRPPVEVTPAQAVEMLAGDGVSARRYAAWALMLAGDETTLGALWVALGDEDADVRWFAAEAMFRFGPLDVLPRLLEMAHDDMAGASLVDFCVLHGEATIPALVQALKEKQGLNWWRSLPIGKALERIGDAAIPYVEPVLKDELADNRQKASTVLSRLSGTPSVEQGMALSHSQRSRDRRDAARILAWSDEPRAVERLIQMVDDPDVAARREAVKMLRWVDHPGLEHLFERALEDPNRKVRLWAQRSLELVKEIAPFLNL